MFYKIFLYFCITYSLRILKRYESTFQKNQIQSSRPADTDYAEMFIIFFYFMFLRYAYENRKEKCYSPEGSITIVTITWPDCKPSTSDFKAKI